MRFNGQASTMLSRKFAISHSVILLSNRPGAMALTVMLLAPRRTASTRVR